MRNNSSPAIFRIQSTNTLEINRYHDKYTILFDIDCESGSGQVTLIQITSDGNNTISFHIAHSTIGHILQIIL